MPVSTPPRDDRRPRGPVDTRAHFRRFWNALFRLLRWIARRAHGVYTTFGILLLSGAAVAIAGTWGFAKIAGHMREGATQRFDDRILRWLGAHRTHFLDAAMLEVTALGTGTVVMMVVIIAALFLWLTRHRQSAILLVVASVGSLVLNNLLKLGFGRPRPHLIAWGTTAMSSSFPSGHSMNAVIVYGTVAYLAARLQQSHAIRVLTFLIAAVIIVLVCASRLYLGVHYPSDVAAGLVIGLAWVGFCTATLEAIQLYARRAAPELTRDERPAPPIARDLHAAD